MNKISWILLGLLTFSVFFIVFNIRTNNQLIKEYKKREITLKKVIESLDEKVIENNKVINELKDSINKVDNQIRVTDNKIYILDTIYENKINNISSVTINQLDSIFSTRFSKNGND